jgi:hypothetical protein
VLLFLLQTSVPETTTAPGGETTVVLDSQQMQLLLEHGQGNAHFIAAWIAGCVFCLGTLVLLRAVGGR